MTKIEYLTNTVDLCFSAARRIAFGLAAFSLAAIYVSIFSAYNLQDELLTLEKERTKVQKLINEGATALNEIRSFYEGPAEDDDLNFSSFIYALQITEHHLNNTLKKIDKSKMSAKDIAFLEYQSDLIGNNAYELSSGMQSLIKQKQNRVSFLDLTIPDLLDLDYHKGKGAWSLYNEWSSLRYALYTPESYGYSNLPSDLDSLEKRYRHFISKRNNQKIVNSRSRKAGRNEEVVRYLNKLSGQGFFSFGDAERKKLDLDSRIEKNKNEIEGMVKLPFIDQAIDVVSLVWIVPMTIVAALLFILFYILKAKQILGFIEIEDPEWVSPSSLFAWIAIPQVGEHRLLWLVGAALKSLVFGLPILVALALVLNASTLSSIQSIIGASITVLSVVTITVILKQLSSLQLDNSSSNESTEPEPNKSMQPNAKASAD